MDAGPDGGTLTTRPITFNGTQRFVNAKVPDGALRAEVLDESGQPIEPFTLEGLQGNRDIEKLDAHDTINSIT